MAKRSSKHTPKTQAKSKSPRPEAAKPDRVQSPAPAAPRHEPRAPLADRMRPRDFDEFVGQSRIAGEGALLRRAIETGELTSVILWGPPGTGKT